MKTVSLDGKKNKSYWETSDFYSAVLVRASGINLSNLVRRAESDKFLTFQFNSTPETCEEILRKHWDRSLKLETRLIIETINALKTRIHEKAKEGNRHGIGYGSVEKV
jgi:hypothetical protein